MTKAVIRTWVSECTAAPICGGLGKKVGCSQMGKTDLVAFQKFILMFGVIPINRELLRSLPLRFFKTIRKPFNGHV